MKFITFVRNYFRVALLIALGMGLLLFDFLTKTYVYHIAPFCNPVTGLKEGGSIPVFYDCCGVDFYLSLATNTGAAWGMFENFQILLVALRIAVIIGMFIYLFFFNKRSLLELPFVFIIAGALGNILDFFLYGYVIDFLHFNLWGYHFPIFNFADTCITIGVIWLFCAAFLGHKGTRSKQYDPSH